MLFRSNDTATTDIYTVPYTLSLHDALPIDGRFYGSLSVSLNARPNAFVFEVEPRDAVLIARAGLRIRIDAYTPEG